MTRVCVAIDSTNQPVRNSAWPACRRDSITQNVRKSKIELMGPNTDMNRRMNRMSHARRSGKRLGVDPVRGDRQLPGVVEQVVQEDLGRAAWAGR